MTGIRWTREEYAQYLAQLAENVRAKESRRRAVTVAPRAAVPIANMESDTVDGSAAKDESEKTHPRFRIHYHSRRRRRCDPDGVYSKAATDGLVAGGLLPDDSLKYVSSVEFSQELSQDKREETVIEIWRTKARERRLNECPLGPEQVPLNCIGHSPSP